MPKRLAVVICCAVSLLAQAPTTFQYFYDDLNQLTKVVDSTGVAIEYVYDSVGNILQIKRSSVVPGALTIFNITPQQAGPLVMVTIQGQGFGAAPSANTVRFNGVLATVVSATVTTLVVTVPIGATSGTVTVTVGTSTATSSSPFTVLPIPAILSITPKYTVPGATAANVLVTGVNLTGATFTFSPPLGLSAPAVSVDATGTSAVMTVTATAVALGTYALVAANASGASSLFPAPGNSYLVLNPLGDEDLDGLSNAQEVALGTDPFNPDTDGDGYIDGVEAEVGSDPRNPLSTPLTVFPVKEAVAPLSVVNRADPSQGTNPDLSVSIRETLGVLSVLNTSDASSGSDPSLSIREAIGPAFSVLNSFGTSASLISGQSGRNQRPTAPYRPPAVAPVRVWISSPKEGTPLLEGQTVMVTADVSVPERVEIAVNDVQFAVRENRPYEMLFTVPYGIRWITFRATAIDGLGHRVNSESVVSLVAPDVGATVHGKVVGPGGKPISGATVTLETTGLAGQFFRFETPLNALPELGNHKPDVTKAVSAVNIRNPAAMFGLDPFGTGLPSDWAGRFRGFMWISEDGKNTFTLGAREGGRLMVAGSIVVDMPTGSGVFEEKSGTVLLTSGWVPIEVLHFQNLGYGELQLSYAPPGGERQVISPERLRTLVPGLSATTDQAGEFEFLNVPAAMDALTVRVEASLQGAKIGSQSPSFRLVSGARTDVGTISFDEREPK
jgi:YD repeat-containing protein